MHIATTKQLEGANGLAMDQQGLAMDQQVLVFTRTHKDLLLFAWVLSVFYNL